MEHNLGNEAFGASELADQMSLSRSQLHRKIHRMTGNSTTYYMREFRLSKAKEMLTHTDLTVAEIGYQCGFSSPTYFSSAFTHHFNITPGQFRISAKTPDGSKEKVAKRPALILIQSVIVITLAAMIIWFVQNQKVMQSQNIQNIPGSQERSIVVMPIKNLNLSEDEKYLCEGMFGAICNQLSSIDQLRVIPAINTELTMTMTNDEIRKTSNALNLLTGRLQRHEDAIRCEINLIDLKTSTQIWGETYDREYGDLLTLQSEIAEEIALALELNLTREEKAQINMQGTENAEAYDLYLKGLYEWHSYTQQGTNKALQYFNKAITLDSGFAFAYTGAGLCYIGKAAIFGAEMSAIEGLKLAKFHLDKALSIKPDQSLARSMLGFYYLYHDWDFKKAEQEYLKAIESNNADALAVYVDLLHFVHRHDEAMEMSKRMDYYNPYFPNSRMLLSLYYSGKYEEAEEYAQSRLMLFNNYFTLDNYGFFLLNTGRYQESIKYFNKVFELEDVRYPRILGWMGAAYARLGDREKAMKLVEELEAIRQESVAGSPAFFLAVVYSALGEKEQAIYWLSDAIENHEMEIPWLLSEPQFYPLHSHSNFRKLVDHVGFPEYAKDYAYNLNARQQ